MNKTPMSKRIAATALSASLLLSCCLTSPPARATGERDISGASSRSAIVDGDLGDGSVQYLRDRDGVDAGKTYAIFYNTTRSILYHTGTGKQTRSPGQPPTTPSAWLPTLPLPGSYGPLRSERGTTATTSRVWTAIAIWI